MSEVLEKSKVYRKLQKHLDKQVIRFPKYKSGADINMLKGLFSPKQAEPAIKLSK